jgi:hypothetical protein
MRRIIEASSVMHESTEGEAALPEQGINARYLRKGVYFRFASDCVGTGSEYTRTVYRNGSLTVISNSVVVGLRNRAVSARFRSSERYSLTGALTPRP